MFKNLLNKCMNFVHSHDCHVYRPELSFIKRIRGKRNIIKVLIRNLIKCLKKIDLFANQLQIRAQLNNVCENYICSCISALH